MRRALLLILPVALLTLGACGARPQAVEPWAGEMLNAVNASRAQAGAPPLQLCGTLQAAAQGHSDFQASASQMTHTGWGGTTMRQRAESAGYAGWTALAENVASGSPDVGSVMGGWLRSPGHRKNLLNPTYQHVGFGLARGADGTPYWTQDFGRSGNC